MIPNTYLVPESGSEKEEFNRSGEKYRRAVGLLNYLGLCTRPDLAFVAIQMAQFLDSPGTIHWLAFKGVLQYLKVTVGVGLTLGEGQLSYASTLTPTTPDFQ